MQFEFDATQVTPSQDRTSVPAGTYPVILQSTDIKPGKAPSDRGLKLSLKILDGPLAGSMIFQNLNILHTNPVAQQIGQERLSALCHAVGVLKITDTAQLHGRPFQVKVSERPDDKDPSKIYNEIDAFLRADGSAIVPSTAGAPGAPAATPSWAGAPAGAPVPNAGAPAPAAPTPAPAAPAPAAATPAPTPAPAPVAAPEPEKQYFVAHNGQNLTPQPIPLSQVLAMPQGLAALMICEVGGTAWQPGLSIAPPVAAAAAAPAAPAAPGTPPWLQA